MNPLEATEITRKRLLWRAAHRGIKEMDLLIGGFARVHLATMSETKLREFTELLELPDQELLDWLTGMASVPPQHDSALLRSVLAFRPVQKPQ